MWQEIVVGLCVLLALAFLLRRYVFRKPGDSRCGGCNGCTQATRCGKPPGAP